MTEITKKCQSTEISLETEKLREVEHKWFCNEKTSETCRMQADEIVNNRLERRMEESDKVRPNELLYSAGWKRIEQKIELTGELKAVNPHYSEGRQWKINCQRCVPTFEMRMRGYDVTALPKPQDEGLSDLSYSPFDVWYEPKIIKCSETGRTDIEKSLIEWGNGSRAQIVVVWRGTNSGHTFMAVNKNGKIEYYDPQTGAKDVFFYFRNVQRGKTKMCRVDNLDVTSRIKECCRKV